jgi:hypothetical protein
MRKQIPKRNGEMTGCLEEKEKRTFLALQNIGFFRCNEHQPD